MSLVVISRTFKDDQNRELSFPYFNGYDRVTAKYTINVDFSVNFSVLNSVIKSGTTLTLTNGTWEQFGFVVGATISGTYGSNAFAGTEVIAYIDGALMNLTGLTTSNDGTYDVGSITTNSTADAIDFLFNLVPNNQSGSAPSLIDGEVNRFTVFLNGLSVSSELDFTRLNNFSGGSYMEAKVKRIADVGTKKAYEITVIFNPWTVKLPDLYTANNCPKPWVEIDVFPQFNNAGVKLTTTNTPNDANVGLANESGNGGIPAYTLHSCAFTDLDDNPLDAIDYAQVTKFNIRINGAFTSDSKFNFFLFNDVQTPSLYKNLPTDFNQNSIVLTRNTSIPVGTLAGTLNSATRPDGVLMSLSNVVITNHTTYATITGRLTPNSEFTTLMQGRGDFDRNYKLWIRCEDSTLSNNLINPVWVRCSEANFSKEFVPLGEYEAIVSIGAKQHDGQDVYKIIREDDVRFIIDLRLPKENDFEAISIGTVVRNTTTGAQFDLEKFSTLLSSYPELPNGTRPINYVNQRLFNLSSENLNNVVLMQRNATLDNTDNYGVKIDYSTLINWKEWLTQNNATLDFFGVNTQNWIDYITGDWEVQVKLEITTPLGSYQNYEALPLLNYDSWDGVTTIEWFTLSGEPITQPFRNEVTKLKVTHTPTVPIDAVTGDEWGQITVEPFEAEKRFSISTVWTTDTPNCPLVPLPSFTKLKKTVTTDSMVLECLFDPTKINTTNGISVSSRCDLGLDSNSEDEEKDKENNTQNRHKEDFQLSTLPPIKPIDERENDCCCKYIVMAENRLGDDLSYKNDISSRWAFGEEVVFELYKNGELTDFIPSTQSFPNDENAKYCTIAWKDVFQTEGLGAGCYTLKAISTVAGLEFTEILGEFELREFDWEIADRTVRLRSIFNDANQRLGINFTNANVVDDIRVIGDIEDFQPNTIIDNLKYSDYSMNKVKRENATRWTLNIEPDQFCTIDRLINLHLVGENTILLSDYNAKAYDKTMLDRAMILSQEGGGAQMESFRGSAKKGFQADFEKKVQDNFTAYGFIGQSGEVNPSVPLIPNVVGGTCEDVNLTLNGNTFLSVPSGDTQDIELLDQNGDVIVPDDVTGNVITVDIPTGGTNSAPLMKTGQTTSYRTGDDGDIQAGRDVNFFNVDFVNFFGNSKRFTGITGGYNDETIAGESVVNCRDVNGNVVTIGQAFPEDIILDWSTYNSTTGDVLGYAGVNISTRGTRTWEDNIDYCLAFTTTSFPSGWRASNINEGQNIQNIGVNWSMQWIPVALTSFEIWVSNSLVITGGSQSYVVGLYGVIQNKFNSSLNYSLPVRTFNISEL
jgi:hypothetical protein